MRGIVKHERISAKQIAIMLCSCCVRVTLPLSVTFQNYFSIPNLLSKS